MDSTFKIEENYGKLIGENNKLQKLVTDLNLRLNICQVKSYFKIATVLIVLKHRLNFYYSDPLRLNLRLLLLVHNQLESLPFLKKLSVKIFYRPETAVLQSVHCISICSSLIKTAQKFHIMTTQKRARLNKIIST